MNFNYITRICEYENQDKETTNIIYLNMILNKLMQYISKQMEENQNISMQEINNKVNGIIQNYLSETSESKVRNKIIEYYLGNNKYSAKTNVRTIFDKVYDEDQKGKIDLLNINTEELKYSYDMTNNMENLIKLILHDIRNEKAELNKIEDIDVVMNVLKSKSSRDRASFIRKVVQNYNMSEEEKKILLQDLEKGYKLYFKDEKELVEERLIEHTETARKDVKEDCIKCITKSIEVLDEFGLLEYYTKLNNKSFKKIYINDINYTYEQVKEMLNEQNLKKLNVEELMLMSSFWTNRVNKVIKEINEALYIVNHQELLREEDLGEEGFAYSIKKEDMKNINLKMSVIHKMYFDLFNKLENEKSFKPVMNIMRYINGISRKHENEYKEYFDRLFPNSINSLKEDMIISNVFENARYNSYKIKAFNMQALLISLFNSNSKIIENFGYIKEPGNKKEILIGVDIKGFNMPFALHINKDLVLEFLRESQGNTLFPVYKGSKDFKIGEDEVLKAQILIPLTKEADEKIKKATDRLTPRDRYAKAVRHINYLRKQGKMPEHMMVAQNTKKGKKYKYVREYVDLAEGGSQLEKSR